MPCAFDFTLVALSFLFLFALVRFHSCLLPRTHVPNPYAASRRHIPEHSAKMPSRLVANPYASATHQPSHAVNPYVVTQQSSHVGNDYDSDSDRKLPGRPTHSQPDDM